MRHRPDSFTELYFEWRVSWIIARIIGAVGGTLLAISYFVLASLFPGYSSQIAVAIFIGLVILFVVLVIAQIYLWCAKPKTTPEWVPHGAIANPEPPWLDSNGNKLYVRVGDRWERLTPEK